jgi:hypothetical protein
MTRLRNALRNLINEATEAANVLEMYGHHQQDALDVAIREAKEQLNG